MDTVLFPALPDVDDPQAAAAAEWLRAVLAPGARLCLDSRRVRHGDAFLALPGRTSDGRDHVRQAVAMGAAAVVWESEPSGRVEAQLAGTPARRVGGLQALLGPIASRYYGRPSEHLELLAVTGTNGKTSVSQWLAAGLETLGRRSGVIGTLGQGSAGRLVSTGLTTPDAPGLQEALAGFVAEGIEVVAMEASSIGLEQGRMNGSRVGAAIFTNLTRDHLDYHGTMERYAQAKAQLLAWPTLRAGIVNGDDPACGRMLQVLQAHDDRRATPALRVVYGFAPQSVSPRADAVVRLERLVEEADGVRLQLCGDFGTAALRLAVLGRFNASNAVAVAATWLALGFSLDAVVAALERLRPVTGRMQTVNRTGGPLVVVDYAHTPDALAKVLESLRPVARVRGGRLWCVFGAGGDRDTGKRPQMGRVAEQGADLLVLTSDNPRSESPDRILSDIRAGLSREPQHIDLDRGSAIDSTITAAEESDVILIAGKGHEAWQEVAGERLPFSDSGRAAAALAARAAGGRHA